MASPRGTPRERTPRLGTPRGLVIPCENTTTVPSVPGPDPVTASTKISTWGRGRQATSFPNAAGTVSPEMKQSKADDDRETYSNESFESASAAAEEGAVASKDASCSSAKQRLASHGENQSPRTKTADAASPPRHRGTRGSHRVAPQPPLPAQEDAENAATSAVPSQETSPVETTKLPQQHSPH